MRATSRSGFRMALLVGASLLPTALIWYGSKTRAAGAPDPTVLARRAISRDPSEAQAAILALRSQGPTGLRTLFDTYKGDIDRHVNAFVTGSPEPNDPEWGRITTAIDAVAQQKDCYASHLYWYTDLSRAERAAQVTGRPILSLRLLGRLNDELSCANSRFFRTTLYPNIAVSLYLQSHYILHWQSERPVPTFTLDFGDGRKIVRTLTGNSIHYILDSRGHVIDALPGLYGPQAFLRHLTKDEAVARKSASLSNETARTAYIRNWHRSQLDTLATEWQVDGAKAYGKTAIVPTLAALIAPVGKASLGTPPSAITAGLTALSKTAIERPIVTALSPGQDWLLGAPALQWDWDQIGQLHLEDALLDGNSRALIASKHPDLSRLSAAPPLLGLGGLMPVKRPPQTTAIEPPSMNRLIENFQRSISQDSIRNEYVYHAKLHEWFANGAASTDLTALNRRVYSDLFQTPASDRWLGLAPVGVYTALPNDGLVDNTPSSPAANVVSR